MRVEWKRWRIVLGVLALVGLFGGWLGLKCLHRSWIEPRAGETLREVAERLGPAEPCSDGAWLFTYAAPSYWVVPVVVFFTVRTGPDGRVQTWTSASR